MTDESADDRIRMNQMSQSMDAGRGATPSSMQELLDRLDEAATGDETSLEDIIETMGGASFVPVLMVPALAVVTPLSGIPAFSSICGIFIALVAAQSLFGRDHLWLPGWLTRRTVPSDRLRSSMDKL